MFITVNGARLFADIEGAGLVPDGAAMREKPTIVLLHGGPGADHTIFKPLFSPIAEVAQIVYFDHRGNGRSGGDDPETWTLAQWADDVKGLCDALGIEKPVVYGASFGGFVAQAYATRYPDHPGKLVLTSTAARVDFPTIFDAFERLGGAAACDIATAYWMNPTPQSRARYLENCLPLYRANLSASPPIRARAIMRDDVAFRFNGPEREMGRMDFRADLARVRCPVLVMAGGRDPIMPMAFSEEIVSSLPVALARFERFPECGHGVVPDAPGEALRILREFLLE